MNKITEESPLPVIPDRVPDQLGAVLLSDEIKRYAENFDLITPFSEVNLKAASYQLSVGGEKYAVGGELKELKGMGDVIEIPPFNVVIIQTKEVIKMPRDLIARWNIRVSLAYKGLLWVGGPQVDPGYNGHLYCPIYNLSNDTVKLSIGETIATIDFTKTTPFNEAKCKKFEMKRKDDITEYNYKLKSGLFTEVSQRINTIEGETKKSITESEKKIGELIKKTEDTSSKTILEIRSRLDAFIFAVITIIGVILTVISVLITYGKQNDFSVPIWILVSLLYAYIALMFTIYQSINKVIKK